MDCDPAARNIAGVIERFPDVARDGIELRKFGLQIVEGLAQERVHPSWVVPGGVNAPMTAALRDRILADLPGAFAITEHALSLLKSRLDALKEEIEFFGSDPTLYAALVDAKGQFQLYDGAIRFMGTDGDTLQDNVAPEQYADFIGEASLRDSYLKAPYYKPMGYPAGVYRVGPLARLNVAESFGTARADAALQEFRQRFGRPAHSALLYHYARLVEILYALERIRVLIDDPQILDPHIRATAGVNALEGVGVIEAPRGLLIHHYKVDEKGAMVWANLIVATGHNNLAMGKSVQQVAEHFVHGPKLEEGMLNRVSAVIRAYDPCLSCSTHATGQVAMRIQLLDPHGDLLDELVSD
jgi:NAD-reducing hydrogenase large subunit